MFVLDQDSLRMSLIPKENLSNSYLILYSMFDEFGLGRGATFFWFVGISRDYRHKIRPLNAERRGICAVGSALAVMSDPSPINTDPPHRHRSRNSLDFISPLLKFSLARRRAVRRRRLPRHFAAGRKPPETFPSTRNFIRVAIVATHHQDRVCVALRLDSNLVCSSSPRFVLYFFPFY